MANKYYKTANQYAKKLENTEYTSQYGDQIKGLTDKVLNPKQYQFDVKSDPVAKMALDYYQNQNKMAAKNVAAQANANSMGWGNTYGAAVAGQSYRRGIEDMTSLIPEMEQSAYSRYQQSIENDRNNLNTVLTLDDMDYGRFRDTVADNQAMLDYYTNRGDNQRSFNYQRKRDKVADKQYEEQFEYTKQQDQYNNYIKATSANSGDKIKTPKYSDYTGLKKYFDATVKDDFGNKKSAYTDDQKFAYLMNFGLDNETTEAIARDVFGDKNYKKMLKAYNKKHVKTYKQAIQLGAGDDTMTLEEWRKKNYPNITAFAAAGKEATKAYRAYLRSQIK